MTRKATSSIPLRPSRWAGRAAVIAGALCAALTGSLLWKASKIPALNVTAADEMSVSVVDRDGRLLRAFTTPSGRWRLPVTAQDVDRRYRDLLLAYEDKRFFDHGGVDALAVLRAGTQLAMNGRIVSGASTLTMQVARLLEGRHDRSFGGKMRQMVHALALERRYSKREILDLYFGLAPFGGNIEGVRAASLAYFGKEPRRLSLGEAALLVALPQSPETRRPDRHPAAAKRARAKVLERARGAGLITSAESARAESEPIPRRRQLFPNYAPHLADRLRVASPAAAQHRTTLNRNLQRRLEDLVHQHAQALGKRLSAAMIVVDHTSGDIVAHVGSPDYFDHSVLGAIDMTGAVRSPGSALKPIVYGMAFERGLAHPQTLIDDRPVRFGTYAPRNFDEDFRGTITIREALGRSLNIPAVKL
ncbi:MAG: penicillin-binding protein 1C, partial [Hyphomicrobiaceae bacterium]